MTDSNAALQNAVPAVQEDLRTPAIIIYALYIAAVFSAGLAGIVGVIMAYVKRDDARGTIWESHYANQIESFWIWLVLFAAGCATVWVFFLGIAVVAAAFIYFLFRTVKGLIRAIDSKPYA
jgi:uncharacterized membrane protein